MDHSRRFELRPKTGRRPRRRSAILKITPSADSAARKVFSQIGVPEATCFKPDAFQVEALAAIETSDCLVSAPTGAGKTWIAIEAIRRVLTSKHNDRFGRCWYASPLKALSNSKLLEFKGIFGEETVGILTGDRKENMDAPIIVGTTEILRNQLYDAMHQGHDLAADLVVLDEAHYLGDADRGVVWEETMIYLPMRVRLLMLSATIGNAIQIADWLASIRGRECTVVTETRRPVPLYPLFFHPSGTLVPFMAAAKSAKSGNVSGIIHKKVLSFMHAKHPPMLAPPRKLPPFGDILRVLRKYDLLPAIFFLKSRADCNQALELCDRYAVIDPGRRERLSKRIGELTAVSPHMSGHRQLWHLEHLAVGAHHAGQLPAWKLILETLMTEGLLDAVFTTSTMAAGVNFPARSVAFLNSDRYNGKEFVPLESTAFHQMTGRAGRRGMDNIGFAIAIPGKFMDLGHVGWLIGAPSSDVVSQIRINFSMVLNLLLSHRPRAVRDLLHKSLAAWQLRKGHKKPGTHDLGPIEADSLWRDFLHHLEFLKENGYVTPKDVLSEDGMWASQLRVDQPLMIAEGFRRSVFPKSDPALLAGMIAVFVNERETDDTVDKTLFPKSLKRFHSHMRGQLTDFAEHMLMRGFETRPLMFRPAATLYAWAAGQSWEKVLRIAELAEGDLAMLIVRTADNLRQIRNLSHVFPEVAQTAAKSLEMVLRDPVTPH